MTPLFFGDSGSALLGFWTQPSGATDRDHGVVLCPPIGQEHVRTHWAMRQAAAALCRAGFHCFRFDWFGVGDSAGTLREASVARWKEDLETAAQELRDTAGVQRISLVGLRLGASLIALAGAAVRPSAAVLWDPIVDGRGYIASLRMLTRDLLTDRKRYWNLDRQRRPATPTELVGFDFGDRLVSEIEQLDLRRATLPAIPTCIVRSSDEADLRALAETLRARPDVEIRDTELRAQWTSGENVEQLLLPGDAIRAVTSFLESRAS